MTREEITLQLTLKALECRYIPRKSDSDTIYRETAAFNAEQIADFYNIIYNKISVSVPDKG